MFSAGNTNLLKPTTLAVMRAGGASPSLQGETAADQAASLRRKHHVTKPVDDGQFSQDIVVLGEIGTPAPAAPAFTLPGVFKPQPALASGVEPSVTISGKKYTKESVRKLIEKLDISPPGNEGLLILYYHLPKFIEEGVFGHDEMVALAGRWLGHNASLGKLIRINVIVPYFGLLLDRNLITRDVVSMAISALIKSDKDLQFFEFEALHFLTEYLSTLASHGLFGKADYLSIVNTLITSPETEPLSQIKKLMFLSSVFSSLIELGWFEKDHYRILHSILQNSAQTKSLRPQEIARSILSDQLTLLVENGFITPADIFEVLLIEPDIALEHFYFLRSKGFFGERFLDEVVEAWGFDAGPAAVLKLLGKMPDWLASQRRWQQLADIIKDPSKSFLFKTLLTKIADEDKTAPRPEDVGSFITLINSMEMEVLLAGNLQTYQHTIILMNEFVETAKALGAYEHPTFKALAAKISTPSAKPLLLEWTFDGMSRVWKGYRDRVQADPSALKKTRNLFLNFAQQNLNRPLPSIIRPIIKSFHRANEAAFVKKLEKDADTSELAELRSLYGQPLWRQFLSSDFYWLFTKASQFMNETGMASMRRLILGLEFKNGRLTISRYDELEGIFSDDLIRKWSAAYSTQQKTLADLDPRSASRLIKNQLIEQVSAHMSAKKNQESNKLSAKVQELTSQLPQWIEGLRSSEDVGDEVVTVAASLLSVFEAHYGEIRTWLGDEYANIRTDLRNFVSGMQKGVKVARKSERFTVSGGIDEMARSGSEPVITCQTLEFKWVNESGESINRILHGQFNVANWEMDGTIVARRLLEITIDGKGLAHLLAHMLYTAGGFARIDGFGNEIEKYAAHLGIDSDRVHFHEGKGYKDAPGPLHTGDKIYRDGFKISGMNFDRARNIKASSAAHE